MSNTAKNPKKSPFPENDQSFQDRATHLQKNIYGSDKGKLRLKIIQRDLASVMQTKRELSVLDAGCGLGMMSQWALEQGHRVLACDSAEVMVSQAQSRLSSFPKVTFLHAPVQSLAINQQAEKFDVIFCHAVIEWVEAQEQLIEHLSHLLKPNGVLSLMFYNAWAREMAQLVYGNFAYIEKNYQVRQRVKLSPHWPCFPDSLEQQLLAHGMTVNVRSGIRIFYDIMRHQEHHQTLAEEIIQHELRVSREFPYWQMGRYVHFLAEKRH